MNEQFFESSKSAKEYITEAMRKDPPIPTYRSGRWISRATEVYAEKRGLSIDAEYLENQGYVSVGISVLEDGYAEFEVEYEAREDGSFNLRNKLTKLEDLPAYVRDEKHLRQVIDYIADNPEYWDHYAKSYPR